MTPIDDANCEVIPTAAGSQQNIWGNSGVQPGQNRSRVDDEVRKCKIQQIFGSLKYGRYQSSARAQNEGSKQFFFKDAQHSLTFV